MLCYSVSKLDIVKGYTQSTREHFIFTSIFLRHHADAAICYLFHRAGLNIITQQHISLHKFPIIPLSSSTVRQNLLNTGSQEHIFPPDNDLWDTCESFIVIHTGPDSLGETVSFQWWFARSLSSAWWADLLINHLPSQFTKQCFRA